MNRTTLGRRIKGTQQARDLAHAKEQLFDSTDEETILKWVEEMDDAGFPINHQLLRQMAQSILKNRKINHQVGINWPAHFIKRHPQLKTAMAHYQEKCRMNSTANELSQRLFYCTLYNLVRKWRVTPDCLWNCDEKGITAGRATGKEVVIVRASTRRPTLATGMNREFTSVLETVNARGQIIPPFIAWTGKTQRAGMYGWDGVHEEDATFTATASGYMDDDAGFEYISEHFDVHTEKDEYLPKKQQKKSAPPHRVLIVDGHHSHLHFRVIEYASSRNIHMICLPPHSTHIMQPLDVGCFGILAREYKKQLRNWVYNNAVNAPFHKKEFWECLVPARKATYTSDTIISAWKASGCWPIKRFQNAPGSSKAGDQQQSLPPRFTYRIAPAASTPHNLRDMVVALKKQSVESEEYHTLLDAFTKLSLEKVTQYRDIQPQAATFKALRSGKHVRQLNLKYLSKGRLLNRKEVKAGIQKLLRVKEEEEIAAKRREERFTAAQNQSKTAKKGPTSRKPKATASGSKSKLSNTVDCAIAQSSSTSPAILTVNPIVDNPFIHLEPL